MILLNPKKIGKRLKDVRLAKKLSLQKVADSLGLTRVGLFGIESGKNLPAAATLNKLKHVYGVSVDWILYGKGD